MIRDTVGGFLTCDGDRLKSIGVGVLLRTYTNYASMVLSAVTDKTMLGIASFQLGSVLPLCEIALSGVLIIQIHPDSQ
jgi:hypothetical protein